MDSISVVFLFESIFWDESRRNHITRKWLLDNPSEEKTLCDNFVECFKELLYGDIRFKMNHQMLTFFTSEKYPIMFRSLNAKERSWIFHIFRYREKVFKTDKHLGAGMFSLENSLVDNIIENIIPRKSLVISYIKQALEIAGLNLKRTFHLAVRKLRQDHATDAFLMLLDNFFQNDEGDLIELDHLPGDIGMKPSKQKRSLNINWEIIISDLAKKKKMRSKFSSQKKKKNSKEKRGRLDSENNNIRLLKKLRGLDFVDGSHNLSCIHPSLLHAK